MFIFKRILCLFFGFILHTMTGLDIGARPLSQASVKNCWASTNHGSLAQFGEYDFDIQNILFKINVTLLSLKNNLDCR